METNTMENNILNENNELINQIDKVTNQIQKETVIEMNREHYKLLTLRENHSYELSKINKEIDLQVLKENNRHKEAMKDLELKKIELEMLKIQKSI